MVSLTRKSAELSEISGTHEEKPEDTFIFSRSVFLVFAAYLVIVFLCFSDALGYYFTKEDFYVLDIGGMNQFLREFTPAFLVYRPLAIHGYFAIGRHLFGMNPVLWHLANLVLHALAGALLFLFALRLTTHRKLAFLCGLAYLVNLANFHAIYWVTICMQSLTLLAALAVWLLYFRAMESGRAAPMSLCVVVFIAALLLNEVNVVIPGLLLVYGAIYRRPEISWPKLNSLDLWLWAVLGLYVTVRVVGFWLGGGLTFMGLYETRSNWEILRNMIAMLTMMADPLYLLSMSLISKGVLPAIHTLLWNPAAAALVSTAMIVLVVWNRRKGGENRLGDRGKLFFFAAVWAVACLIPSSAISPPVPWRANVALVGYCLILAGLLAPLARTKPLYVALVAVFVLWGWWGMDRIRSYDDPNIGFNSNQDKRMGLPIHIHRSQIICRNITEDVQTYLEAFPQVEELMTPNLFTNGEFYHATFAGQQFNVILPKRVKYLYPSQKPDPRKTLMVLLYSEEDSRLRLAAVVPPER
ncbi:MAG: hypothetical protein Kow0099_11940 [Candidatus Abyssubacteria bacterium]